MSLNANATIYIRDYTQLTDEDSAAGIREAIRTAIRKGAERVVFEPGRYRLNSVERLRTEGMVHDAGSGNEQ